MAASCRARWPQSLPPCAANVPRFRSRRARQSGTIASRRPALRQWKIEQSSVVAVRREREEVFLPLNIINQLYAVRIVRSSTAIAHLAVCGLCHGRLCHLKPADKPEVNVSSRSLRAKIGRIHRAEEIPGISKMPGTGTVVRAET